MNTGKDCGCPMLGHYVDCPLYKPRVPRDIEMTINDQPPPVPNDRIAIADLVINDMHERKRIGIERYGMPLQAFNGRDPLVDAYQEALDLVMYLRQVIEERSS